MLASTLHIPGENAGCDGEQTADTRVLDRQSGAFRAFDGDEFTPTSWPPGRASSPDASALSGRFPRAPSPTRTDHLTITSRIDAMRHDEAGRVHAFSWLIIVVSLFTLALLPVLGGDPVARGICIASLGFTILSYGWLLRLARKPDTFHPRMAGAVFLTQGVAVAGVAYYFGVFSPLAAILAIALYVFSLGSSFRYALLAYLHFAGGMAILAILIVNGTIVDRGLITAAGLSPAQQIGIQLCVQLVLLVALLLGRISRRRTVRAIHNLEIAVHELARREALLHEARFALARAEQGGPGRFTDQVVGSFELGAIIGRGAMGEVYEARHVGSGVPAAVKLLHGSLLGGPTHVDRLVREARVAASLSSPHLVKVLEVAGADQLLPYLAMERLVGRDLWHILRDRATLPMDEVLDMVAQVSAGLQAMSRAGIVHRDLKPQNLFLAEQDRESVWKVLDFGVSKHESDASLTDGHLVGTPAYMAPEQARGGPIDHRADLYSLAVIVYRCMTGRPAFAGSQIPNILYEVAHTMPVQPSKLAPLPHDIDSVLAIAMAKNPADRFDHVGQFARHLSRACRGVLSPRIRTRAQTLLERQPWRCA